MASCTTTGEGSSGLSYSTKQTIAKSKFDTTRSVKFDQTKNQKHCKFKGADPTMETSCKRLRLKSGSKSSLICIMFFVTTSTWCLRLEKKQQPPSSLLACSSPTSCSKRMREWDGAIVFDCNCRIATKKQHACANQWTFVLEQQYLPNLEPPLPQWKCGINGLPLLP